MSTSPLSEILEALYPDDDGGGVDDGGDNANTTSLPSSSEFEVEIPDKSGLPPCKFK